MSQIKIENNPDEKTLNQLGVKSWSIWTKEVSKFPWFYDDKETCYILEGEVTVTPEVDEAVSFSKGDLVTFPKGMSCTWDIKKAVKKHYKFG